MSPAPRDTGVLVGVMSLEDDARVDFTQLRRERRAKVLAAMERHRLDVLVLGGTGNVHYVSGSRQLGRAGVIPFAPACIVVRSTERVHLLAGWDEGVPPEIGTDDMYGILWNPGNLLSALAEIPGRGEARRVGTDGMTPMFAALLPTLFPGAELVDGAEMMTSVRRLKLPAEIICLDVASAVAEAALSAMETALTSGVTERELLGLYDATIASLGAPIPPSEGVIFATPRSGPVRFRHVSTDRPLGDGELVVLAPGALYAGYEAGLARTRLVGRSAPRGAVQLAEKCARGMDALLAACRAGNTGRDLYRAWEKTGNPPSPILLAHGMGIGTEPPLIGLGLGADESLEAGMVLCVQSWVTSDGTGGFLERATVKIDESGPIKLTRYERLRP